MKDLLNSGQILGRSEMKKIMAGSGGSCQCYYDGCSVVLIQGSGAWGMSVCCSGLGCEDYGGIGTYGGTACGGACP
tara:strand:- start:338 stop:565 length:228 start_codon:yes stop_codon:yes gene_type:complete